MEKCLIHQFRCMEWFKVPPCFEFNVFDLKDGKIIQPMGGGLTSHKRALGAKEGVPKEDATWEYEKKLHDTNLALLEDKDY